MTNISRLLQRTPVAILCASLLVSGCSFLDTAVGKSSTHEQLNKGVDVHSTFPIADRSSLEHYNLIELIDPSLSASQEYADAWSVAETKGQFGVKYDLVLNWFRISARDKNTGKVLTADEKKYARNGVQEKMMMASLSRCNVFKTYLQRNQSDSNFWFGLGSTVSGILGATLPGATASRNLAGTAGLFSGVQAEYNQAYFANLAASTIVRGIEARQAAVQTTLRTSGQPKSINEYSMEAAISDAIYFDGLCSTRVGLQEAENAIRIVNNPGLNEAASTMLKVKYMSAISSGDITTPAVGDALKKLQSMTSGAVSPIAADAPVDAANVPKDIVNSLSRLRSQTAAAIQASTTAISTDYSKTYAVWTPYRADAEALPAPSDVSAKVGELLTSTLQASVEKDIEACKSTTQTLAQKLVAAQVDRALAIKPEDVIVKQLAVDRAVNDIESQNIKLQLVLALVSTDIAKFEPAAKATWAKPVATEAAGYKELQAKMLAFKKDGWPQDSAAVSVMSKFSSPKDGQKDLCSAAAQ